MKKTHIALAAFGIAIAAQQASAQSTTAQTDAYISVYGGSARASIDCEGTTSCDRTSGAAKVLFGYRVLPNLAIEASYAYLGKVKASVDLDGDVFDASIKGQSLGIGIAGLFPFGSAQEWTGIARVGVATNRARVSASGGGISASDSERHTEPYFGVGLNYAFTPNFEAGLALDSTKLKYADQSSRVNVLSAVASFRF